MNNDFAILGKAGQRILRLYHIYRLVIALALVLLISSNLEGQLLNITHASLLTYSSWCYLIFNIFVAISMQRAERLGSLFALAFTDIALLSLLFYAAGGTPSGIGNLIVAAVAVANILLYRHIGLVIAALGAAGIIYLTFYLSLTQPDASNQFMQAGVLGMLCFAAALFIQLIGRRLVASETLVKKQASTVANLEALNTNIIERMRTGILVLDPEYNILQANPAVLSMLECKHHKELRQGEWYSQLLENYQHWQKNPARQADLIQFTPQSPQLQPSFVLLKQAAQLSYLLILLEDTKHINQKAQQLKLMSLGRLAAGIAHEIRNPLGAISHAAQLLNESDSLVDTDQRLSQIIQEHARRLNFVIENVLQLSRQRHAEPQLLDLKYWLHRYVSAFQSSAPADQQLELQVMGKGLQTRMDAHQLDQVLNNLVGNAMRHTPLRNGKHVVRINLFRDPTRQLPVLEVLDSGRGVPEDDQAALFEPFFTTEQKGTGLGLYISRELCESNQARLDYVHRPAQGGCFRITFAHPKSFGLKHNE